MWIHQDDPSYRDLTFGTSSQQSLTDLEVQALTDARALFTLNDIISSQDQSLLRETTLSHNTEQNTSDLSQYDHREDKQDPYCSMNTTYGQHRICNLLYRVKESKVMKFDDNYFYY